MSAVREKRTQRSAFDPDRTRFPRKIISRIQVLAMAGAGPKEIEGELFEHFPGQVVPSRRTIQTIVTASKALPRGDWWTVVHAPPDEVALVLPVIAYEMRRRHAAIEVSADLARWIARLRRGVPDLPVGEVFELALSYWLAETSGAPMDDQDRYLALHAWEPANAAEALLYGLAKVPLTPEVVEMAERMKEDQA